MNELSLASMRPSLRPLSQGLEMALAQVRMGHSPSAGAQEADPPRRRTLDKQEVRVCSVAPAAHA